jgi:hypothetical protein
MFYGVLDATDRDYQYDSEIDIVENLAGKPDVIWPDPDRLIHGL